MPRDVHKTELIHFWRRDRPGNLNDRTDFDWYLLQFLGKQHLNTN